MASGGARITIDLGPLKDNIRNLPEDINKRIGGLMSYQAGRVGSSARVNAKWTDRTSNARNGLQAGAGKANGVHFLVLAHRVPYGIWLEVRWSGRYAIILPTLQEYGPVVMSSFEKLLDKYEGAAS